ncbi:hypothetical protein T01_15089 [Trichinella spiralis]|uniref:Uncharacterized protein n=1 Tax=Trichinella spiralis TaxID=6334 RepID=A0A0V1BEY5_TRISP|nr:hypothetical protein T01_15089 [Trichinella spiralis]
MQIKQVDYSTLHYVHDNFKCMKRVKHKPFNWKMNDGDTAQLCGVLFSPKQLANIDGQLDFKLKTTNCDVLLQFVNQAPRSSHRHI